MGNLFGQIIAFLTSPFGVVVIVGLMGGVGRLLAWIKEQRVRRAILQARAQQASEALRTGRPTAMDGSARIAATQPARPRADEQKAAELRAVQEQRTAQLRALQQKRLAELRAKRAQQGQAPPAPPPAQPTRRPTPPGSPRPRPLSSARPAPRQEPGPRPAFPVPKPTATATPSFGSAFAGAEERAERAAAAAPGRPAAPVGFAPNLVTREDFRRAIIASEVLGLPLALREPDEHERF